MRLEGRTALVTGGASGIGAATTRRLAAEGARVAIGDVQVDLAREVAGEIDGLAVELDVTDVASVEAAVARVASELGHVDVLVNNAGTDRFAFFVNTDEALWDFVIGVNLKGVLACTHAVLPAMHERGGGSIVSVASEAGRVGSQGSATYSAAKAGVIGLTKSLGKELAKFDIAVNAITPATANTRILETLTKEFIDYMLVRIPRGRFLEVEEAAAMVAWLVSKENSFTTASVFDLSGGRTTY